MKLDLKAVLLKRGVKSTQLDLSAARALDQRWLAAFAVSLPEEQCAYRWHTFSFHHYPHLEGAAALSAYLEQWSAPFYIFDESLEFCSLCVAQTYPDLSDLQCDIYVSHRNLKWTAVFTHEQPHIGPFFAQRSFAFPQPMRSHALTRRP